jgi:hypothetical protein
MCRRYCTGRCLFGAFCDEYSVRLSFLDPPGAIHLIPCPDTIGPNLRYARGTAGNGESGFQVAVGKILHIGHLPSSTLPSVTSAHSGTDMTYSSPPVNSSLAADNNSSSSPTLAVGLGLGIPLVLVLAAVLTLICFNSKSVSVMPNLLEREKQQLLSHRYLQRSIRHQ